MMVLVMGSSASSGLSQLMIAPSPLPLAQLAELLVASESLGHCLDSAILNRL